MGSRAVFDMQHIPENGTDPFEKTTKRKERLFIENNMEKPMHSRFFSSFIRVFFPFDRGKQYYGSINRADRE